MIDTYALILDGSRIPRLGKVKDGAWVRREDLPPEIQRVLEGKIIDEITEEYWCDEVHNVGSTLTTIDPGGEHKMGEEIRHLELWYKPNKNAPPGGQGEGPREREES